MLQIYWDYKRIVMYEKSYVWEFKELKGLRVGKTNVFVIKVSASENPLAFLLLWFDFFSQCI